MGCFQNQVLLLINKRPFRLRKTAPEHKNDVRLTKADSGNNGISKLLPSQISMGARASVAHGQYAVQQ